MRGSWTRVILFVPLVPLVALGLAVGCGGRGAPPPAAPSVSAPTISGSAAPPAAPDAAIRRLLLETATAQTCAKAKNAVIGLPAAATEARIAGRWFLHECADQGDGQNLSLALGGPGWMWINDTSGGPHIHQYVYFYARASLGGALEVSFDERARVASVWLTPSGAPTIAFSPLSGVTTQPQNPVAKLLGVDIPSNLENVSGVTARAEVLATSRLKEVLERGATITYKTASGQLDLNVGRVDGNIVPRPFPTAKWLVNERQEHHPGGFHLAGPFPYTPTAQLEASIESGFDLQYATVCADSVKVAMAQLATKEPGGAGKTVPTNYVAPGQPFLARLNLPLCDWALVTYSRSDTIAAVSVIP